MSLGTVNKLRLEASSALFSVVEEAKTYVQNSRVVGADEARFAQGNVDGCNQKNTQAWLWVMITPLSVLNAIFYILVEGVRWRSLGDFPPWQTVHTYFRNWRKDGTWLDNLELL